MFNVTPLPPGSACNVGCFFSSGCMLLKCRYEKDLSFFLVACRIVEFTKSSEDSIDKRCTDDGSEIQQSNDHSQSFLMKNDALGHATMPIYTSHYGNWLMILYQMQESGNVTSKVS
jgi:hypothetical protein